MISFRNSSHWTFFQSEVSSILMLSATFPSLPLIKMERGSDPSYFLTSNSNSPNTRGEQSVTSGADYPLAPLPRLVSLLSFITTSSLYSILPASLFFVRPSPCCRPWSLHRVTNSFHRLTVLSGGALTLTVFHTAPSGLLTSTVNISMHGFGCWSVCKPILSPPPPPQVTLKINPVSGASDWNF